MELFRRILFYIFLGLYLILCPLIVMYSLGYILSPKQQEIIQTGIISLASSPPGAYVYLGKSRYAQRTPTVINNLLPGKYSLRVTKKNYFPWSGETTVRAGKAAAFENIILLPQEWEINYLSEGKFRELIPLSGTGYFLASKSPRLGDYFVYDRKLKQMMPLVAPGHHLEEFRVANYFVNGQSPFILLQGSLKGVSGQIFVEVDSDPFTLQDITPLFQDRPVKVFWDTRPEGNLFSLHKQAYINKLNVDSGALYPKFLEEVKGFGAFNRFLYTIHNDNSLYKVSYDKSKSEILESDFLSVIEADEPLEIYPLENGLMLLLGARGSLAINQPPYRIAAEGVLGFEYHPENDLLCFWQRDKIGVMDFSEKIENNGKSFEYPGPLWVYAAGKQIKQCSWVHNGSHIVFRDRDQILFCDLNAGDSPRTVNLLRAHPNTGFFYEEEEEVLYFLDQKSSRLASIQLIPEGPVIPEPASRPDEETLKEGDLN